MTRPFSSAVETAPASASGSMPIPTRFEPPFCTFCMYKYGVDSAMGHFVAECLDALQSRSRCETCNGIGHIAAVCQLLAKAPVPVPGPVAVVVPRPQLRAQPQPQPQPPLPQPQPPQSRPQVQTQTVQRDGKVVFPRASDQDPSCEAKTETVLVSKPTSSIEVRAVPLQLQSQARAWANFRASEQPERQATERTERSERPPRRHRKPRQSALKNTL